MLNQSKNLLGQNISKCQTLLVYMSQFQMVPKKQFYSNSSKFTCFKQEKIYKPPFKLKYISWDCIWLQITENSTNGGLNK